MIENNKCLKCGFNKNNKGQLAGYEALIILILFAAIGGLCYLMYSKKTDVAIYQADSKPNVSNPNIHPLCGIIFDINRGDKPIVNSSK